MDAPVRPALLGQLGRTGASILRVNDFLPRASLCRWHVTPASIHERELVEVEDHSAGLGEAVLSGVLGESRLFFSGR